MIKKLVKKLKSFKLEDLELIAETDCTQELETLLKQGCLEKVGEFYEYIEKREETIVITCFQSKKLEFLSIEKASEIFLKDAQKRCKKWTVKTYISIIKTNILPYFRSQNLAELELSYVLKFYEWLKTKNLSPQRTKNTMALLNQLVRHFQELGSIDRRCDFRVQRLDSRKSQLKNVI